MPDFDNQKTTEETCKEELSTYQNANDIFFKQTYKFNLENYHNYIQTYNRSKISVHDRTIKRNITELSNAYTQAHIECTFPNPILNQSISTSSLCHHKLFYSRLFQLINRFINPNEKIASFENIMVSESFYPLFLSIIARYKNGKNEWSTFRKNVIEIFKDFIQIKYGTKSPNNASYTQEEWINAATYILNCYFCDEAFKAIQNIEKLLAFPDFAMLKTNIHILIADLMYEPPFHSLALQKEYYKFINEQLDSKNKIQYKLIFELTETLKIQRVQLKEFENNCLLNSTNIEITKQ